MTGTLLGRYIAWRFAGAITTILVSAIVLIFFVNLTEVLRNHGGDVGFSFATGLLITGLQTPAMIDDLLPFVFLFAAMLTLLNLSRKLELVVARATGMSAWQFLLPVILVAVGIGVLSTLLVNPLALEWRARAQAMEALLDGDKPTGQAIWLRQKGADGSSILTAGARDPASGDLIGVRAFLFDGRGNFLEKVEARRAEFRTGVWALRDTTVFSADVSPQPQAEYLVPTSLDRAELDRAIGSHGTQTVWTLPGLIDTGRATGLNVDRMVLAFNALLARPIFFLAMVTIAGCVSLRLFRYGGVLKTTLTGIAAGFVLYVFTKIVQDLGGNGVINPMFAAWMPPIVAVTFGFTTLLVQEDG